MALNALALEIVIVFLLIMVNGVFAMSEIAVVAARKSRLRHLADSGDTKARAALNLAENPNRFLATVQVGITLVGILAGAFGGATIAGHLAADLNRWSVLAPYGEAIGVGVVVVVITFVSLIMGELVPKRLALHRPERIASMTALPMGWMSKVASPIVRVLDVSTNGVIRLLGIKQTSESAVTLEEVKGLIEQGTRTGVFEETEQDMIENVLRLDERPVGAWMTPRTKIVWLDIEDPPEAIRQKMVEHHFSRYPVARGNLENVIGIVRAKDLLAQSLTSDALDLKAVLRPPFFIPEGLSALDVLELLKQEGTHIALVTDEYGGIEGLITHNDILEDIVGSIPTAGERSTEPQVIRREDGSWLVDGLLEIERLKEVLEIAGLGDEQDRGYHTVGGFVMSQVHGIPSVGQHFEWGNWRFEVVDMDGRRVDKVLVGPIA